MTRLSLRSYTRTFEMYGMSLNLEFLNASSPLMKRSKRGVSSKREFNI